MEATAVGGAHLLCSVSSNAKTCAARRGQRRYYYYYSTQFYTLCSPPTSFIDKCGLLLTSSDQSGSLHSKLLSPHIKHRFVRCSSQGTIVIPEPANHVPQPPSVQTELIRLCLPAIAGQAIEPLAQLMETAYIGRLGSLELASAGVSISIFNIVSKVFNIPLLSVATSFVAEDVSKHSIEEGFSLDERMQLPSVSTALLLSLGIGILEATALYLGSGMFLSIMGISTASPMRISAHQFLQLRALGCPAVVLSLAIQGIFRGFKDTETPVKCLGLGNMAAVFLFPILMYGFHLGVTGAAISSILSQYIVTVSMIWHLNKRTVLVPNLEKLQFGGYLKSGGFLLGRTLAAVMTVTLSTSMAARQGPLSMAAHQIILQVWLSASLLADAQSSSSQALIASSFAKGDYNRVREITYISIKAGLFTGILLAIILSLSFGSLATLFTKDVEVLNIVRSGLLFISASQPITALAYIFDGLHYGISDFMFAACSMMVVGALASAFLLWAPPLMGLSGVWSGLTLFMTLRTVAGLMRLLFDIRYWSIGSATTALLLSNRYRYILGLSMYWGPYL